MPAGVAALLALMLASVLSSCVDDETARLRECEARYASFYTATLSPGEGMPSLCFDEEVMSDFRVPPRIPMDCELDAVFEADCTHAIVDARCTESPDRLLDVTQQPDGTLEGTYALLGEDGEIGCIHDIVAVPAE